MEPEALRFAELRNLDQRIDNPRGRGARSADNHERQQAVAAIFCYALARSATFIFKFESVATMRRLRLPRPAMCAILLKP
jgi:hypothetical protein